jgi:hypothetical protein
MTRIVIPADTEVARLPIPCGGCGAKRNADRCIGCLHDFGDDESAWVRKYRAALSGPAPGEGE